MNHLTVHMKLTQHCKSTALQYKIKKKFFLNVRGEVRRVGDQFVDFLINEW